LVLLEQNAVGEILQVGQRLSLPANEATGVIRFHIEQQAVIKLMRLDGRGKAEGTEEFLNDGFG
jgi:hypothetical protein